jgi:hypothetical protein
VQQIARGVSADAPAFGTTTHGNKRAERDKIAPKMKELAEAETPIAKAAKECGMEAKPARLIARENGFKFTS